MSLRHALVCAPVLPEFDRESGSRRIFDLTILLQELGWTVTYVAQQAQDAARYVRHLEQRGIATYVRFDPRAELAIESLAPEVAVLAFWHVAETMIPILRRISPETRIIVDSVDLHWLRNARRAFQPVASGAASCGLDEHFGSETARELNVYAAADGVLTVSRKEAELINDLVGDRELARVVPDAEDLPASTVPFAGRRGILFLGNFQHAPNVDAAKFLCDEVVAKLEPALLAEHPIYVVGNAPNDQVRACTAGREGVRLVGWVPTVLSYLQRARICVIPLRYGAGTKRKLLQSLLVGTPSVSTTIGVEGLDLAHEQHVLVADDPSAFAAAISRLLQDEPLWQRLSLHGREQVAARHGRDAARARLETAVAAALERVGAPRVSLEAGSSVPYNQVVQAIRSIGANHLPPGATVLVVSRGDDQLLQLSGLTARHFPQAADGRYAGHHPADSAQAIAHLEALRAKGAEFLLLPSTAFWWLDHYSEFRQHLDAQCERVWSDTSCIVYGLSAAARPPQPTVESRVSAPLTFTLPTSTPQTPARPIQTPAIPTPAAPTVAILRQLRPVVPRQFVPPKTIAGPRVLVLGVYLAAVENNADDIIATLAAAGQCRVTQRWVALGGAPPTQRVAQATVREVDGRCPKFQLLNELLAAEELSHYDYVLTTDDDVVLPEGFLDQFLAVQDKLGFALAQPARTGNSYIDHPIVEQQWGVLARRTLFVEIGPVVSFHRSCFDLVFPFDLTSPMGWGYENRWAYLLAQRGLTMGIIDAVPVDHSLRKPVAHYEWSEADRQRSVYLKRHKHLPLDECFRILDVIGFDAETLQEQHAP